LRDQPEVDSFDVWEPKNVEILIIDDDMMNIEVLRTMLQAKGI